ncbi:DUF1501 domain-containing protein [Schlesneria paludicola]|uniref:DUF1501 domain-containing protein n=1 Tax=Schlesneria paludicola TaxID=360056 RepID=UPI00029B0F49|nr:DUF1501 domain-containing protein [Schlesneria paludicola]
MFNGGNGPFSIGSEMGRRNFFQNVGTGIYGAALASLLSRDLRANSATDEPKPGDPRPIYNLSPRKPQFEPKAKAVIHLFMNGGPSQMDLLDPKPALDRMHGQSLFEKIAGELESPGSGGAIMRSPFKFKQHGQSGMWVSNAMPHFAECVDDVAMIHSMHTVNLTHEPALYHIHSGRVIPGQPSLGSWVTYGLGSESENLPAYVVLDDPLGLPVNGTSSWASGYLPPIYQGTRFKATGTPVLNLDREYNEPDDITDLERSLIGSLDRMHRSRRAGQNQLDARIASYELAAKMQMMAPEALDLSQETAETLAMYGIGEKVTDSYGRRCLIARRLVERGVRFVQLFINSQIWDTHDHLQPEIQKACDRTDKPVAALIKDLKARGLFDDVLVLWGGEFGRLPIAQLRGGDESVTAGRDHNKNAFSCWMAGAGIKAGQIHGTTDEIGLMAVENKVSVTDWHATILHLLGLNYEDIYYERNGLKEKLTGVEKARVVQEILA